MSQIVVNIDVPSDSEQPALDAAIAWRKTGDVIFLFHNLYHPRIVDDTSNADQMLAEARDLLLEKRGQQLAQIAERVEGVAEVRQLWARTGWQALIKFAQERGADMVVTQARPHTRWQRLKLSNEDWELIRHCPMPLLLARDGGKRRYQNIVAAIDPLHEDDKPAELDQIILNLAVTLAERHDGAVTALNLVPPSLAVPPSLTEPMISPDLTAQNWAVEQHEHKVAELAAAAGQRVTRKLVEIGDAAEQIVDFVRQEQADLLVMGAIARSAIKRMLVGSTAEQVLDRVPCDVLIAKPARFESRLPSMTSLLVIDY